MLSRAVPAWYHSPAFSIVDESIHRRSTDKARPFVVSTMPAILFRIEITATEGPGQCSAHITN